LYDTCGDDTTELTVEDGTVEYDLYCPCWDADGSNVGDITELPALLNNDTLYGPPSADHTGITLSSAAAAALRGGVAAAAVAAVVFAQL
jgi:hypothetical protein